MTFIPEVLTQNDPKNTLVGTTATTLTGISSSTVGYNSIIVDIDTDKNSEPLGLKILFSGDGFTFAVYFCETVFATNQYQKSFPIVNSYYKISYTPSETAQIDVRTRLSTQQYTSVLHSVNAFINEFENAIDAFGKQRVTNPLTLLDLRTPAGPTGNNQFLQNDLQICSAFTGSAGATGYKESNLSQTKITVSGGIGTYINQSLKYCVYQPGKSLMILASVIMNPTNSNPSGAVSRVGYFDNTNGLYFEYDSAVGCSVCKRNNGTVTSVSQTSWNIDSMDGSGNSGVVLDFSKAQICIIDLEWLGSGRIRYGFYIYGKPHYCHEITNVNILTAPFTSNINLPLRYELTGANASSASLIQICGTVISEGGYNPTGRPFALSVLNVSVPSSIETAILAIRGGGSNYYHQNIIPQSVSYAFSGVGDIAILRIRYFLPNASSGISSGWFAINAFYSVVEGNTTGLGSIILANSIIIEQQAISGRGSSSLSGLSSTFNDILQVYGNVENDSSIIVVTVEGQFGGSSRAYATLNWLEAY